jgi:hypothetical protein
MICVERRSGRCKVAATRRNTEIHGGWIPEGTCPAVAAEALYYATSRLDPLISLSTLPAEI